MQMASSIYGDIFELSDNELYHRKCQEWSQAISYVNCFDRF